MTQQSKMNRKIKKLAIKVVCPYTTTCKECFALLREAGREAFCSQKGVIDDAVKDIKEFLESNHML